MFNRGDTVVCAVSGGPDSVCLAHVLREIASDYELSIHLAHLNHGIRGKEAERDARLVEIIARDFGLPLTIGHEDVPALAASRRIGLEEAAREARYRFLAKVAEANGATHIAVGHTMNDQAETVLMRLLRGSGTTGLAGMPAVNGMVVRPLIEITREQTESYCREKQLLTVTDSSNLDLHYTRNRVRYSLIPRLKEEFNPSIIETLSRTAAALRWDADFLEGEARREFAEHAAAVGPMMVLDEKMVSSLPKAIRSRVYELAWRMVSRPERRLDLNAIVDLMESESPIRVLAEGVRAWRYNGHLIFLPPNRDVVREIAVPGVYNIEEFGIDVNVRLLPADEARKEVKRMISNRDRRRSDWRTLFMVEPKAYMDYNKCGDNLLLRTWKPGDRMVPLGLRGNAKKVQDIFTALKVPRLYRDFVPLFLSRGRVAWLGGLKLSDEFKLDDTSEEAVEITITPHLRELIHCATIT